jgi:hypothetical protein
MGKVREDGVGKKSKYKPATLLKQQVTTPQPQLTPHAIEPIPTPTNHQRPSKHLEQQRGEGRVDDDVGHGVEAAKSVQVRQHVNLVSHRKLPRSQRPVHQRQVSLVGWRGVVWHKI